MCMFVNASFPQADVVFVRLSIWTYELCPNIQIHLSHTIYKEILDLEIYI